MLEICIIKNMYAIAILPHNLRIFDSTITFDSPSSGIKEQNVQNKTTKNLILQMSLH